MRTTGLASTGASLRERDGSSVPERKAVYRVQTKIAAMSASLVVQLLLWPDQISDWAKEVNVRPSVVYNMLAGPRSSSPQWPYKPYHRVRELLAKRLGITKEQLDYLIDAPRPQPRSRIPLDPPLGGFPPFMPQEYLLDTFKKGRGRTIDDEEADALGQTRLDL